MTVLLNTTFLEGQDDDPWPSPWVTSLVGGTTGGGITQQSGRGHVTAHSGSYNTARASAEGVEVTDGLFKSHISFVPSVNELYNYILLRTSGGWSSTSPWEPMNGYFLYLGVGYAGNNEIALGKKVNGVSTNLAGGTISGQWEEAASYGLEFSVQGSLLRARVWKDNLTVPIDPPPWQLTATDSQFSSGGVSISLLSGSSTGSRSHRWVQPINFTSSVASEDPIVISSDWTNYIIRSTVGSPEQTNNRQFFTYNGTELVPVDMYVGGP